MIGLLLQRPSYIFLLQCHVFMLADLLALLLELLVTVSDVAEQTAAVEVVVALGLSEGLVSGEVLQADDTLTVGHVTLC